MTDPRAAEAAKEIAELADEILSSEGDPEKYEAEMARLRQAVELVLLSWGAERDAQVAGLRAALAQASDDSADATAQVARLTEEIRKLSPAVLCPHHGNVVIGIGGCHACANEAWGWKDRTKQVEAECARLTERVEYLETSIGTMSAERARVTENYIAVVAEAERLRAELAKQQIETRVRDSTITALRAELAQVKGEVKTANRGIDLQWEQIRFLDSEVERKDKALREIAQDARRRCLEDHPEFADGTEAVPHELVCSSARLEIRAELAVRPALSPVAPAETSKLQWKPAGRIYCRACGWQLGRTTKHSGSCLNSDCREHQIPQEMPRLDPSPEAPHAAEPKPASFVAAGDGEACRIIAPEPKPPHAINCSSRLALAGAWKGRCDCGVREAPTPTKEEP